MVFAPNDAVFATAAVISAGATVAASESAGVNSDKPSMLQRSTKHRSYLLTSFSSHAPSKLIEWNPTSKSIFHDMLKNFRDLEEAR
jgi:hypothetical protein